MSLIDKTAVLLVDRANNRAGKLSNTIHRQRLTIRKLQALVQQYELQLGIDPRKEKKERWLARTPAAAKSVQ